MMFLRLNTNVCFFLAFLTILITRNAFGAELPDIPEIPRVNNPASGNYNIDTTMIFQEATIALGSFNFKTRAYNGNGNGLSIPGPTLRIKRGDTVKIKLINNLNPIYCGFTTGSDVKNGVMNEIRDACITNLHTHGLHVSSMEPQDNVEIQVLPGANYEYIYSIPSNHLGGTHWYHPHHHGSTSNHVDGGASGMIIVDDDASDNLNSVFTSMLEKVIILTAITSDIAKIDAGMYDV
jgi:FtsP/CotA-like multicopper oxidase with cupredoxin domain